ncbi:MAG: FAD-dependent oxidoreductase, partial [Actinomycetota bacterium]|nr:FAD-dependent oxidoreductase [Actinomycetota bacterium]
MSARHEFDVIVVGGGAAGAATAWSCARRGLRVLILERFEPGHDRGSSHGTERIVRLGHTDRAYVDLAVAALAGWNELEALAGEPLLVRSGAVDFGIDSELEQIEVTMRECGLSTELLSPMEAMRRFDGFHFDGNVLFHADGGTVLADRALDTLRRLAAAAGAVVRSDERVVAVEQLDSGVAVRTATSEWRAATAVVTAGAWAPDLLAGIVDLPAFRVTQEQLAYFRPRRELSWPAFLSRTEIRRYGMLTPAGLVKVAEHHTGPMVHPDFRPFEVEPVTWARLCEWVRHALPGVDPTPVHSGTCLYASTADEDFLLDRVGDVVVGVGLSGHGFKFVPEIGRRLADLVD